MTESSEAPEQTRDPLSVCFTFNLHDNRPLLYPPSYSCNGRTVDSAFHYTFTSFMNRACVPSERHMFEVGRSSPAQGQAGTIITATLNLNFEVAGTIYICIVAGVKHLETKVRKDLGDSESWMIQATMPQLDELDHNGPGVPLTVQVLADHKVLDFASCGSFTYTPEQPEQQTQVEDQSDHASESEVIAPLPAVSRTSGKRRSRSQSKLPPCPPVIVRRHRQRVQACSRRRNPYGLVRVPLSAQPLNFEGEPLSLHLTTPLEDMCQNWSPEELQSNRRLVKFTILRQDTHITLLAERILQADYDPNDIVISCIRYDENDSFHVTSVDILYLFENICGQELGVKEKTRLRRNIQGFSPIRLAKTDRQFASFYHTIMELPAPKPRTIEKKLKAFKWSQLKDVLDKILSKYCLSEIESQEEKTLPYRSGADTQSPPELLYPDAPLNSNMPSAGAEQQPGGGAESSRTAAEPPARLVLRYPGYTVEPTFPPAPSDPALTNLCFDQQNSAASYGCSFEYGYDVQGSRSPVCSTASDVEAAYTRYAYDISTLQYPLDF